MQLVDSPLCSLQLTPARTCGIYYRTTLRLVLLYIIKCSYALLPHYRTNNTLAYKVQLRWSQWGCTGVKRDLSSLPTLPPSLSKLEIAEEHRQEYVVYQLLTYGLFFTSHRGTVCSSKTPWPHCNGFWELCSSWLHQFTGIWIPDSFFTLL